MKLGLLAGCLNPREAEHYQERIWEASGGEGSITLVCATREVPNHRIGRPRCMHPGMVRVETPEQVSWLYKRGVQYCQGWLFAKAMPAREFMQWLANAPAPVNVPQPPRHAEI